MGSLYDRTSNIYDSNFRQIDLTHSGYHALPDEPCKFVTIHNHQIDVDYDIKVAKVDAQANLLNGGKYYWDGCQDIRDAGGSYCESSGTAYVIGVGMTLEEGFSFEVRGITNANQVALAKGYYLDPTLPVRYVVEK